MRSFFTLLAIVCAVAGFFMPLLWAGTVLFIVIAMGSSSGEKREDGKATTGGLLGGVWDKAVIDHKRQKEALKNK